MAAIETRGLGRVYRPRRGEEPRIALADLDMEIGEGEVHGLLGPNGAGKTTLVRILSTVLAPSTGRAAVLGHDVAREPALVKANVGVVFGGERGLYTRLTARQNLEFWSAMYRIPRRVARARCAELLARVGLSDRADDPVEQLSRGMKQRLHLARGMVHSPRVLFLDEPTSGMDPLAAREFRRVVEKLRAEGRTVLLTTHDMAEAEALCDQVSVIDKGRMILDGRPEEVVRRLQRVDSVDFALPDGESLVLDALRAMEAVEEVRDMPGGDEWRAVPRDEEALREILAVLVRHGVRTLRTARPSLEEAYLELMPSSEVPA